MNTHETQYANDAVVKQNQWKLGVELLEAMTHCIWAKIRGLSDVHAFWYLVYELLSCDSFFSNLCQAMGIFQCK